MDNNTRETSVTLMMKTLLSVSTQHTAEKSALLLKSLHEEIALHLPCHLVPSTVNTRGHRERFIQIHARTHVFANRPVYEWNRATETIVSPATVDVFKQFKLPI